MGRQPKREAEYEGRRYKVRSDSVAIPDLTAMPRISALLWLCRETYARGHQKPPNPLIGFGGAIKISA